MSKKNILTIPSITAVAIYNQEITGQISDGMWENSNPYKHWTFWCDTEAKVGDEITFRQHANTVCRKRTGYALHKLIPIIGDRMRAYAAMALVLADAAKADPELAVNNSNDEYVAQHCAEYLARGTAYDALPSWCKDRLTKYDRTDWYKRMHAYGWVSVRYNCDYGDKELRKDLTLIKKAMKHALAEQNVFY